MKIPEQTLKLPVQQLSVELAAESIRKEVRSIDAIFYAGAKVQRSSWFSEPYMLQFSTEPAHVRLSRLNRGAPVLRVHSSYTLDDVLGVVERDSARMESGTGKATLRFSERADVEPVWKDIQNKILQNLSMGAVIHKMKDVTPTNNGEDKKQMREFLVTDWEPVELSIVPVPADLGRNSCSIKVSNYLNA